MGRGRFGLIIGLVFLLGTFAFSFPPNGNEVKIITVPQNVKVEKYSGRVEVVGNLSNEGIYRLVSASFEIIDGFLYVVGSKPYKVYKLDLKNGKIVQSTGSQGEGPGQFLSLSCLTGYKDNIVIIDRQMRKMIFYDRNLKFLKEYKFKYYFQDMYGDMFGRFVFYGSSQSTHYFSVFRPDRLDEGRVFGIREHSPEQDLTLYSFDYVRRILPILEENGVWAAFSNRYDFRYYKNERLAVEIREKKNFFKGETNEDGGRGYTVYWDRAVRLAQYADRLYYFYTVDDNSYCDIFEKDTYRLLRRINLQNAFYRLAHFKETVFYAQKYADNDDEDLLLVKIKL